MALFDYISKSNVNFFDENIDDFFINEFDAGGDTADTEDDNDDDIQGIDDSEVDDGEGDNEPATQSDDTTTEPIEDTPADNPDEGLDTQSDDDGIDGMDDSDVDDGMDDTSTDDTTDTPADPNATPDDPSADAGDEELDTIDDDSDGMDDTGDGTGDSPDGDTGDDLGGDDSSLESEENDPHQRLKELEGEIFDQLSEPEKQMKINELKKLYGVLIDKADSLYKLTQEISKTDDTVKMIDYTLNTLMDLKTYLKDYVVDVYDNRTYLQNSVNFQKFLTIFDAVHSIFKEIKKQLESDDKN